MSRSIRQRNQEYRTLEAEVERLHGLMCDYVGGDDSDPDECSCGQDNLIRAWEKAEATLRRCGEGQEATG